MHVRPAHPNAYREYHIARLIWDHPDGLGPASLWPTPRCCSLLLLCPCSASRICNARYCRTTTSCTSRSCGLRQRATSVWGM